MEEIPEESDSDVGRSFQTRLMAYSRKPEKNQVIDPVRPIPREWAKITLQ